MSNMQNHRIRPGETSHFSVGGEGPGAVRITIDGPGGSVGYRPVGTAEIERSDPHTGKLVKDTVVIGGSFGPTSITVPVGPPVEGQKWMGEVRVTPKDAADFAVSVPHPTNSRIRSIDNPYSGTFSPSNYNVTVQPVVDSIDAPAKPGFCYPPGYLENLGIDPRRLGPDFTPTFDESGNFIGFERKPSPEIDLDGPAHFTNPQNSPNPADRPASSNDGVKNDTYNGQNSGPNRGLGDGGNKPDGSYFSDLGGGGRNIKTDSDKGPSQTKNDTHNGQTSGPNRGLGNGGKTDGDKGPSQTKNDTHNGQTSGPNRGLGNGGKTDGDRGAAGRPDSGSSKSASTKGGHESSKSGGSAAGQQARTGNDPAGPNRSKPIILDLDGDGIEITELSRSSVFMDSGGDGLLHRTAWAGAGDGVLFFDANGDNRINEKREYVFTEWDPTATSDLAALRAAFDRNGDGRLTAADINFFKFKVLVTNADGSQTARTLTELGIREISLIGDATHITLPDGSVITGQSTFTRTNGTTGTAADMVLVADAERCRVVRTATTDAAGTRTVVSQAYDADGSLASAITSVTSRDGLAITNSYDDDRDSLIRLQRNSAVWKWTPSAASADFH